MPKLLSQGGNRDEHRIPLVCLDGSQSMGKIRSALFGEEGIRVSAANFQTEAPVVRPVERSGGSAFSWLFGLPGVLSIVGTRSGFTPVGRDEIAAVELVGRAGVPAQPWPFVEMGQAVYLDQGPLRGLTGIVLMRKQESKLIISVQLLKRSIAVEIDRTWISTLPVQCRQGVVGTLNVSLLGFEQGELSAQR